MNWSRISRRAGLLLRRAIVTVLPRAAILFDSYRPEKHYMRGPGPKSLSLIGEMFRAETESITREPLPGGWLALMRTLDEQEGKRSERDQEEPVPHGQRRSERDI
jgi:hypothetical protein